MITMIIKINTYINDKKIKIDVVKSKLKFNPQIQKYLYKLVIVYVQDVPIT